MAYNGFWQPADANAFHPPPYLEYEYPIEDATVDFGLLQTDAFGYPLPFEQQESSATVDFGLLQPSSLDSTFDFEQQEYSATADPELLQTFGPAVASSFEQQYQLTPMESPSLQAFDKVSLEQQNHVVAGGQSWLGQSVARKPEPLAHCHKSRMNFGNSGQELEGGSSTMTHVGGHCVLSKDPFKCACGKQFTRLHTLQRHIQATRKHVLPEYPCSKCTAYQGRRGFKRKDHLVQHLRAFHKYDNDRLAAFSAPHKHQRLNIPVCHIKSCEYYRDPKFRELPIGQQEDNRPFDKQSEYTAHMKNEHNWSPYPCKVPGCGKYDGKGFFNPTALENHCQNNHPESAMAALIAQKDFVKHVTCEYCTKSLTPASLKGHQLYSCTRDITCRYCGMRMKSIRLRLHEREHCIGEVACPHCQERMEYRQLSTHKSETCNAEVACTYCQERMEYRQLMKHKSETCKGGVACSQCQERMEYKQLSRHKSETCKGEVACPYCQERMEYKQLSRHKWGCKGEVACPYCQERIEYRQLSRHKWETCKGEVACPQCQERVERWQLDHHRYNNDTKEVACRFCQEYIKHRDLLSHRRRDCPGE